VADSWQTIFLTYNMQFMKFKKFKSQFYLFYNLYIRNLKYLFKESYSQFEEDLFIKNFFKNKKKGLYLDIGCHHPFRSNNTYLLYKKGWSGVNIDAIQQNIDLFNIHRPRDINICQVLNNKKENRYLYIPNNNLLSTEVSINKKFSNYYKKKFNQKYIKKKKILTNTFYNIVKKKKLNFDNLDLLCIDVEGNELNCIKSINLNKYNPKLICIEIIKINKNNHFKVHNYLIKKNYKKIHSTIVNSFYTKN